VSQQDQKTTLCHMNDRYQTCVWYPVTRLSSFSIILGSPCLVLPRYPIVLGWGYGCATSHDDAALLVLLLDLNHNAVRAVIFGVSNPRKLFYWHQESASTAARYFVGELSLCICYDCEAETVRRLCEISPRRS